MTYEQSLENIEKLKNLVIPLDTHQVFFDFSNNFEFEVLILESSKSKELVKNLMTTKFRAELPIARILLNKFDHEILSYEDRLTRYEYDLTIQAVIINDQKVGFKNRSSGELAIEMRKLLLKLKNM